MRRRQMQKAQLGKKLKKSEFEFTKARWADTIKDCVIEINLISPHG